jgi:hypothetical protein
MVIKIRFIAESKGNIVIYPAGENPWPSRIKDGDDAAPGGGTREHRERRLRQLIYSCRHPERRGTPDTMMILIPSTGRAREGGTRPGRTGESMRTAESPP